MTLKDTISAEDIRDAKNFWECRTYDPIEGRILFDHGQEDNSNNVEFLNPAFWYGIHVRIDEPKSVPPLKDLLPMYQVHQAPTPPSGTKHGLSYVEIDKRTKKEVQKQKTKPPTRRKSIGR